MLVSFLSCRWSLEVVSVVGAFTSGATNRRRRSGCRSRRRSILEEYAYRRRRCWSQWSWWYTSRLRRRKLRSGISRHRGLGGALVVAVLYSLRRVVPVVVIMPVVVFMSLLCVLSPICCALSLLVSFSSLVVRSMVSGVVLFTCQLPCPGLTLLPVVFV